MQPPELSRLFGYVLGSTVAHALPDMQYRQLKKDIQKAESMEDLQPWERTVVDTASKIRDSQPSPRKMERSKGKRVENELGPEFNIVDYVDRRNQLQPIVVQPRETIVLSPIINVTVPPSQPIPAPIVTINSPIEVNPTPIQVDVAAPTVNVNTPEVKVTNKNYLPENPPPDVKVVNKIEVQPAEVTIIKDEKKEVKIVKIERTAEGEYKGTVEEK